LRDEGRALNILYFSCCFIKSPYINYITGETLKSNSEAPKPDKTVDLPDSILAAKELST